MSEFGELRLKFTSSGPLKYGANAAAEFDDPDWPRFVRITDVDEHGRLREETFRSLPPEIAEPFLLQEGDILLARSGATVGKSFIYQKDWGDACYAGYLIRLRASKEFNARYLYWCFQSSKYWADVRSNLIQSTIQNVSADRYANFRIPSPLLDTQRRITHFLDDKTARIDALIEKKRALLDRLAEKRQALITHAVTKGLDPNAPMKDSGIDWLGEIPTHWGVKGLKYISKIGNGSTPRRDDQAYWEDGTYPWLNSSVVNLDSVDTASDLVTDCALKECHLPRIDPPAVLVGITGEGRTRGMASLLIFEATINQHLAYIKPYPEAADASYLRSVMDVAYAFLRNESNGGGSTKGAITCEQLERMEVPIPPYPEQVTIAHYLGGVYSEMVTLIQKVAKSVDRLTEYRSALITAAVTGQLDLEAA